MAAPVGIGVLGGRSFVATRAVMPAIEASERAVIAAVASAGGAVPDPWAAHAVDSYAAVIEHPDVEAVYVPLPNGMHAEWVGAAAAAGKAVLCEKPLARDADEARSMAEVARRGGVLLAEAWMTPFDPRWSAVLDQARSGSIGEITHVDAAFTFTIPDSAADNYRWRADQGGGALLDVGIYCLGAAVELWGAEPETVVATVERTAGGVDATTDATLTWTGGRSAHVRCSFVEDERQTLELVGTRGRLRLDTDAHTGGADTLAHVDEAGDAHDELVEPGDPYLGMIDAFADAVRGDAEWSRPVERSIELMSLLDRITAAGNAPT
ncbi:MAG: Gfo/Idh/MocA family oxidoreductase [Ilumatobacter sp.]|uniref:Gfo/Idh/MocA family protein n=1 Tax=Ilumatobacter sp. TaxID=1967498 RepID=UPI002627A1B3|nr:Gfo/Idh/MocA family oxidoreductase [Ilumatobacter sp.]MDJ0768910.1 Gfo/Idh/MocA family oxidoreductase [Ilumatobacter sp.]